MKKITKVSIIALIIIIVFATGVFANEAWLRFTGREDAEQVENDIDGILDILKDVDNGRKTAEEALEDLLENQGNNSAEVERLKQQVGDLTNKIKDKDNQLKDKDNTIESLNKEINNLKEQIAKLQEDLKNNNSDKDYVKHLEDELKKANKRVEDLKKESGKGLEEAQKYIKQKL